MWYMMKQIPDKHPVFSVTCENTALWVNESGVWTVTRSPQTWHGSEG